MFNYSRLWLWGATLHGDRESRRLRPWTTLRLPQKAQPIRQPLTVQVEKLSALCPRTTRKPPGNQHPEDNRILLRVHSPIGRRSGHLLQEGGRELLKFGDSSSTITCEGVADFRASLHWQAVSSLAKKMAAHPLTIGRCGDCLVWDVDEACRIRQSIWQETTVTTAVLP